MRAIVRFLSRLMDCTICAPESSHVTGRLTSSRRQTGLRRFRPLGVLGGRLEALQRYFGESTGRRIAQIEDRRSPRGTGRGQRAVRGASVRVIHLWETGFPGVYSLDCSFAEYSLAKPGQ